MRCINVMIEFWVQSSCHDKARHSHFSSQNVLAFSLSYPTNLLRQIIQLYVYLATLSSVSWTSCADGLSLLLYSYPLPAILILGNLWNSSTLNPINHILQSTMAFTGSDICKIIFVRRAPSLLSLSLSHAPCALAVPACLPACLARSLVIALEAWLETLPSMIR